MFIYTGRAAQCTMEQSLTQQMYELEIAPSMQPGVEPTSTDLVPQAQQYMSATARMAGGAAAELLLFLSRRRWND